MNHAAKTVSGGRPGPGGWLCARGIGRGGTCNAPVVAAAGPCQHLLRGRRVPNAARDGARLVPDPGSGLGGLPDRLPLLENGLAARLADSFRQHPWVENVERVVVQAPRRVQVSLTFRTPVLAVERSGDVRVVDASGMVLPPFTAYEGLPTIRSNASTSAGLSGTRWPEAGISAAARHRRDPSASPERAASGGRGNDHDRCSRPANGGGDAQFTGDAFPGRILGRIARGAEDRTLTPALCGPRRPRPGCSRGTARRSEVIAGRQSLQQLEGIQTPIIVPRDALPPE